MILQEKLGIENFSKIENFQEVRWKKLYKKTF